MWAEGVPHDAEGEMCEEFGEWMHAQIEIQHEGYPDRPDNFRREMAARQEGRPPPPPNLPESAMRALMQLGVQTAQQPNRKGGERQEPLPLVWRAAA